MEKDVLDRFDLSAAGISDAVEETAARLAKLPVDPKEAIRLRFLLEEILLQYRDHFPEDTGVSLRFSEIFSSFRVSVRIKCDSLDPFRKDEDSDASVMGSLLANSDNLRRGWRYRNLENDVTFTIAKKRKLSQALAILIGIACGAVLGVACRVLLPSLAPEFAARIAMPLTNAFTGLLCVMATIMCFCAIALGIVRFGDISTFSAVGKRMIKVFLLVSLALALMNTAWIVPKMLVGSSSGMSLELYSIFDIIISFVPSNILSPILEFNSAHIIVVGIMFGIAMLVMGHKADPLTELMDEVNTVAVLTNGYINRYIPVYVALMAFGLIASGQIAVLSGFFQLLAMIVIGELVTLAGYTLYLCLKLKVSVKTYIRKQLPAFMIALSSASSGAAFTTAINTMIGPLGVDVSFASFAYNLGGILFRPGYCIVFTSCSLFMAGVYGIEVTWSWLLAAFLLSFILSIATPPVLGGTTVCFSILFSQLGLPTEALTLVISLNAIFEFLTVAVNGYCLQSQVVLLGHSFDKLDLERLRDRG